MAILAFRFISAAFLAYFLRKEDKQVLLSLLLEVLGSSSKKADGKEVDSREAGGRVAYSKDIGNRKVGSEKVRGFLADFTLSIF